MQIEKIALERFIGSLAIDIWWGKRGNLFFPGEDKSTRAGKSISWLAARPAGDRTSRYVFYNIFPSQFPFAHRQRELKVPPGEEKEKKKRDIHFYNRRYNFNSLKNNFKLSKKLNLYKFKKIFAFLFLQNFVTLKIRTKIKKTSEKSLIAITKVCKSQNNWNVAPFILFTTFSYFLKYKALNFKKKK